MGRACACLPAAAAPKDRAPSTFIVGGGGSGGWWGAPARASPPRRPRGAGVHGWGSGRGGLPPVGTPFVGGGTPLCASQEGCRRSEREAGVCGRGSVRRARESPARTSDHGLLGRRAAPDVSGGHVGIGPPPPVGGPGRGGGHDHRPHPPPREFTRPPRQPLALLSEGQGRGPSPVCAPVGSGQVGQARDGLTTSRAVGLGKVTGWHGDPCPNGSGLGRGTRGTPQGDW